jgi:chemotaxis family two-component system response regulator Rcp1
LVDDNPGDVRLMHEAFAEGSLEVRLNVAGDGEETLAILRRIGVHAAATRPDLVLLDLNLPRLSGREVLAEIKTDAALRSIPVIVLTTSRREEDVRACYDLHANCCITKPGNLEEYLRFVRSLEDFWLTVATLPPGG